MRGHGPFPYQVDGDYLGETEQLEFRHEPDALTIVHPTLRSSENRNNCLLK